MESGNARIARFRAVLLRSFIATFFGNASLLTRARGGADTGDVAFAGCICGTTSRIMSAASAAALLGGTWCSTLNLAASGAQTTFEALGNST